MQKISVAICGWGNVGRGCKRAIEETSDVYLAGVVRRPISLINKDPELENARVVADIRELGKVDVALLCVPSREIPAKIREMQDLGICTVDSYDEHDKIITLKKDSDIYAKSKKTVAILGAGWDPGTDSAVRAIMKLVAITGHTTTVFGGAKGGRSMGHTVAVKAIPGVKDAVSLSFADGRVQSRAVYVELLTGADADIVAKAIQKDPYFAHTKTEVHFVKSIDKYNTPHHGADVERTGMQANQKYTVEGLNAEFTANVMVSCARAAVSARDKGECGAYTFIERPLIDYLPGTTLDEKLEGY